jgi:hypothetical protein
MIGTWRASTPDLSGAPGRIAGRGRIGARTIAEADPATIGARDKTVVRAKIAARATRSSPPVRLR